MQHLLVTLIVAAAVLYLGLRLRTIWRNRNTPSCGGGCTGCGSLPDCSSPRKTLPQYKPPLEHR